MKKISIILFLCSLISCGAYRQNYVKYVLPIKVESKLNNEIQKNSKKRYFLILKATENDEFLVSLINFKDKKEQFGYNKIGDGNYLVLINDKFYPLVFESDLIFNKRYCNDNKYYPSLATRLKQIQSEEGLCLSSPKISIYENSFIIRFRKNGEIISKEDK